MLARQVTGTRPIRLMLVDDSVVVRSIFQRMLEPRRDFEIVATANSAAAALEMLVGLQVDIILLDVEMPGMDGLTALPLLIERSGGARVLIVSSSCDAGSDQAVRALTLGATDTLPKPGAGAFGGRFADVLADKLARIGLSTGGERPVAERRVLATPQPTSLRPGVAGPIGCIAIGASTGGLHALSSFFQALPRAVRAPILITQHLPATFMPYFVSQIRDIAGRPAKLAEDGDLLTPDRMLIAPGDAHLGLVRTGGVRVRLDRDPAPSGCMPSVDPMLAAVAEQFGSTGVAIVLTGMGRDGALSAPILADAGGEVLVQDQASSVVWGMPGAIAGAGDAAAILPPDAIAARIGRRWAAVFGARMTEPVQWR